MHHGPMPVTEPYSTDADCLSRIPELLAEFEVLRQATVLVDGAFALGTFANLMTHLQWAWDGDLAPDADEGGDPGQP